MITEALEALAVKIKNLADRVGRLERLDRPSGGGSYTLPTATASVLGGVKVGARLSIASGVLSADEQNYSLPTATDSVLGGVKVGARLSIASGVLSADVQGGGGGSVSNLLLNGGFDFFQAADPAANTAMSDDVYNAPDMWYSLVQGANATISRTSGIGKSKNACKIIAGGTLYRYGIAQIVESFGSIPTRGQDVIAQCLIKPVNNAGSGARDYRIAILEWTGTADTVTSEIVADWTSGTFTTAGFFASTDLSLVATASVTATHNVETQLSCTGSVSASCNNLIVFVWAEDVPTHASDYVLIAEAGLYIGSTINAWNPRFISLELSMVQRYIRKSYVVDTRPGTATSDGACGFYNNATSSTVGFVGYTVNMRIGATPKFYSNVTGDIDKIRSSSAEKSVTGGFYGSTGISAVYASSLTVGATSTFQYFVSCYL